MVMGSSSTRVELEPAWVLHTRQYRETSVMLEVLTPGAGRIGLIARGARRPKSPWRALLRPFEPLVMSWSGRGDLATLQAAERIGNGATLTGAGLAAGCYPNELLIRLLQRRDARADVGQQRDLSGAAGEVRVQRIHDLVLVLDQHIDRPLQPVSVSGTGAPRR